MDTDPMYVKVGDVHIAYQVVGEGPPDLVIVPGIFTHLEYQWEEPSYARFLRRVSSFSRLILFDPRGTGLSDRAPELPTLEQQMDDLAAVLGVVGAERPTLLGMSQGGMMAGLFAATYPHDVSGLILYGAYPTPARREGYPFGRTREWIEEYMRQTDEQWGTGTFLAQLAPSRAGDDDFRRWWAKFERLASSPGNALAYIRRNVDTDITPVLSAIRVPTLVLQRRNDVYRDPGNGRFLADRIPGARLVELAGADHLPYVGDAESVIAEVEEFITGARQAREPDRILTTILFTDIVESTRQLAELGDRRWRILLDDHHAIVRRELERFRGREIDTAGDGFLATFDGPARAVRCAVAIRDGLRTIGLEVRAGLHTGEVEVGQTTVRGMAVHIGARVAALAGPGEVVASSTVRDLVAGADITFDDRGMHELKGVPGEWRLLTVTGV